MTWGAVGYQGRGGGGRASAAGLEIVDAVIRDRKNQNLTTD